MRIHCDFTYAFYERMLKALLSAGYDPVGFDDYGSVRGDRRTVLIRHDVDYDPSRIAAMSATEAASGVRGTYCFQTQSRFYALNDRATRDALRRVLDDGHWIGLHFDATGMRDDGDVLIEVDRAAERIEAVTAARVAAVSFHMPTHRPVGHLKLRGNRVNTYSTRFFEAIEYMSDSNQSWRGKDPIDVIDRLGPRHLQILTHPEWWRECFVSFEAKIRELAEKFGLGIEEFLTAEQAAQLLADPDRK